MQNLLGKNFKSIDFLQSFNYLLQKIIERAEQASSYKSPGFYGCQFTDNCKNKLSLTIFTFSFKVKILCHFSQKPSSLRHLLKKGKLRKKGKVFYANY